MEPLRWENHDLLIIDLGEKAVKNEVDAAALFDEIEMIGEDYPDNIVIFKV